MKFVERAMNNCYLGDRTIHPGDHLLFIHELCELFKCRYFNKPGLEEAFLFITKGQSCRMV
jgi:hypothetical protein